MKSPVFALLCLGFLASCADFPQLDAVVSAEARQAPYPSLIPAEILLAKRKEGRITERTGPALLARAERLRARAALIRGIETVDEATRIRLRDRLRALGG